MAKAQTAKVHLAKPKKKRPGVHAKTKVSRSKKGSNWVKPYVGQGRQVSLKVLREFERAPFFMHNCCKIGIDIVSLLHD